MDFQAERECSRRAGIPAPSAFTSINSYPMEVGKSRILSYLAEPNYSNGQPLSLCKRRIAALDALFEAVGADVGLDVGLHQPAKYL